MEDYAPLARAIRQELNEHYQGRLADVDKKPSLDAPSGDQQSAGSESGQQEQAGSPSSRRRVRNRFRLKSGKEASQLKEKVEKLSRRERKEQRNKMNRLKKMDAQSLETYVRMSDPRGEFVKQLVYGGDEGLASLQKRAMWSSIAEKYTQHHEDINVFLNSLTVDELTLFLKEVPDDVDAAGKSFVSQTGRQAIDLLTDEQNHGIEEQQTDDLLN